MPEMMPVRAAVVLPGVKMRRTGDGRNFASFVNMFEDFENKFDVFGSSPSFWTRSGLFGPVRICLDVSGQIWLRLDALGNFGFFSGKNESLDFCIL